jgi:hypothetical protein
MTSVTHHAAGRTARRSVPRLDLSVVRHSALAVLVLTGLLLLLAGAVLLVAATTGTTGVQLPHPIPLPAPTAPSSATEIYSV